jgi:hypothetical protein
MAGRAIARVHDSGSGSGFVALKVGFEYGLEGVVRFWWLLLMEVARP